MRPARLAVLAVAALCANGCLVVSLHPFYDERSIVFDPTLIGAWTDDDEDLTIVFERAEWHSYHVTIRAARGEERLSARLTRVGALTLLDVTPLDGTDIGTLLLPVHSCYRLVRESADEFLLAELEYEHMTGVAAESPALAVVDGRDNVVLTAETPTLREWLAAHAGEEGLFGESSRFTRVVTPRPEP